MTTPPIGDSSSASRSASTPIRHRPLRGVRLAGTGSSLPSKFTTNKDLEKVMETSDDWIVQRTGIRSRYIVDKEKGESTATMSANALRNALAAAHLNATDLDLIILATMTPEMECPASACRVASRTASSGP
jgi:3-oxoacyl-[acyl-carrier-protein] synthase-3